MISMRKVISLPLLCLCGVTLLSGCSGIKTYPNDLPANMKVVSKTESGSMLQDIDTLVHIYQLSSKCESEYLGTVELDGSKADVGLPVGQLLYMNFVFVRGGFFSASTSSTNIDTLLKPKPGAHYLADLQYLDGLYDMEIWERTSSKSGKRKLPIVPFEACKGGK